MAPIRLWSLGDTIKIDLTPNALHTVNHSLISYDSDYCNSLLVGLPKIPTSRFELPTLFLGVANLITLCMYWVISISIQLAWESNLKPLALLTKPFDHYIVLSLDHAAVHTSLVAMLLRGPPLFNSLHLHQVVITMSSFIIRPETHLVTTVFG